MSCLPANRSMFCQRCLPLQIYSSSSDGISRRTWLPKDHDHSGTGFWTDKGFSDFSRFSTARNRAMSCCRLLRNFRCIPLDVAASTLAEEYITRTSADEVRKEILDCYELVHKLGRGAVYLGSARTKVSHPHYVQAMELGREVALLLNCTSWTGAGPGLMDAVVQGAMQAQKPVGGFKICMEAGEWTNSNSHPYLSDDSYLTCRFFSARKHGLVDAGVRNDVSEKTAFVALPGGVGTLDEIFEILALIQLSRIGSCQPVPFLVMNYDEFYTPLLKFLDTCTEWGTMSPGELQGLWRICSNNAEALEYLASFYNIDVGSRTS